MLDLTSCTVSELHAESQTLMSRLEVTSDHEELSRIASDISEIRKELQMRSLIRDNQQRERRKRIL